MRFDALFLPLATAAPLNERLSAWGIAGHWCSWSPSGESRLDVLALTSEGMATAETPLSAPDAVPVSLSLAVACRLSTDLGPIAWLTLSSTAGAAAWVRVEDGRVVEQESVDGHEAYLEEAAGWLGELFDCQDPIELWDSLADALEGIEDVPWGAVGRDSDAYERVRR